MAAPFSLRHRAGEAVQTHEKASRRAYTNQAKKEDILANALGSREAEQDPRGEEHDEGQIERARQQHRAVQPAAPERRVNGGSHRVLKPAVLRLCESRASQDDVSM